MTSGIPIKAMTSIVFKVSGEDEALKIVRLVPGSPDEGANAGYAPTARMRFREAMHSAEP